MRNLVARTYARRAFLMISLANAAPSQARTILHFSAPRATQEPPLDLERIRRLRLHAYGKLRPGRVYSLEEVFDYGNPARLAAQRADLDAMGIRFARCLRVSADAADAWMFLVREREDFSAAAGVTLSAVAPLFAVALQAQVQKTEHHLQAEMAQRALARLGVGQLALDRDGRVMAADPQAEALLAFAEDPSGRPGRRLRLPPHISRMVDEACAAIANAKETTCRTVALDARPGLFLLLRTADLALPAPSAAPAVIGVVRETSSGDSRTGAASVATIAAMYGLTAGEAAIAYGLTRGQTIVEAGGRLRLSPETARNYSKKIYAKTGASGQADLVRLMLTGLTPFC
jgi:DNA-binding CsgD family transcriptional regulator/PAS domain-containing protein